MTNETRHTRQGTFSAARPWAFVHFVPATALTHPARCGLQDPFWAYLVSALVLPPLLYLLQQLLFLL